MKTTKRRSILQLFSAIALAAALAVALAWYYDVYVNWNPTLFLLSIVALTLGHPEGSLPGTGRAFNGSRRH